VIFILSVSNVKLESENKSWTSSKYIQHKSCSSLGQAESWTQVDL
jgi:hypothetical protein